MKKLAILVVLPALGLVLSSGDVSAGATANAANCYPVLGPTTGMTVARGPNAILNTGFEPVTVYCPIPIDHRLGETVTFRVRMFDQNTVDGENITCNGYVYDQNGAQIGASPTMVSGTGNFSGTGVRTATLSVSPQRASYMYSVACTIPRGGLSGINTVRVF